MQKVLRQQLTDDKVQISTGHHFAMNYQFICFPYEFQQHK